MPAKRVITVGAKGMSLGDIVYDLLSSGILLFVEPPIPIRLRIHRTGLLYTSNMTCARQVDRSTMLANVHGRGVWAFAFQRLRFWYFCSSAKETTQPMMPNTMPMGKVNNIARIGSFRNRTPVDYCSEEVFNVF